MCLRNVVPVACSHHSSFVGGSLLLISKSWSVDDKGGERALGLAKIRLQIKELKALYPLHLLAMYAKDRMLGVLSSSEVNFHMFGFCCV